jgi:hypothetical protein
MATTNAARPMAPLTELRDSRVIAGMPFLLSRDDRPAIAV